MDWKELYPKAKKPRIEDLERYLSEDSLKLFKTFVGFLADHLHLNYVRPKYLVSTGWSFKIGRSGRIMIKNVAFESHSFSVDGIKVTDQKALDRILPWAEDTYNREFKPELEQYSIRRSEEQKKRTAKRRQKDQAYLSSIKDHIQPDTFNAFRWSPCVSRQKLSRLYESDARGMLESELLDDVGYTIYTRCLQSRDEHELMYNGKMKCHQCGNILQYKPGLISCTCGSQYLFKDYMKSFRTNNMPSGAAEHIFRHFIEQWPLMKTEAEKMRLIDWVIHEFHINIRSGVKGRPVGINLIQGTNKQVKQFILNLAYGDGGIASKEYREYWSTHVKNV